MKKINLVKALILGFNIIYLSVVIYLYCKSMIIYEMFVALVFLQIMQVGLLVLVYYEYLKVVLLSRVFGLAYIRAMGHVGQHDPGLRDRGEHLG